MPPDDPPPVHGRQGQPGFAGVRSLPLPAPRFEHLSHLTDPLGVWEHAEWTTPREHHGFCTDDNARALIVVCREPGADGALDDLAATYLRFLLDSRTPDGRFRNRRSHTGRWLDEVGSDDSQGRAWWALGVAARDGRQAWMRRAAADAFDDCGAFESEHLRPNAFAVLGAVELLAILPEHDGARDLLARAVAPVSAAASSRIPWFEPRLTYANARLPEALLAAGSTLHDDRLVHEGLRLLSWLVEVETRDGLFSFAPVDGWVPGEARPGFDQQPLEAAAMAEACHRAWTITHEDAWRRRALRAAEWFVGRNDTGTRLYDATSGGTRDGLMCDGANENQGAESTLAGLAALQVAEALAGPTHVARSR